MSQWWIDKGKMMGSSNPTMMELKELYRRGFRVVVSLIEDSKERPGYDVEEVKAIGFKLYSIPIRDFEAPTMEQFEKFLSIVKATPISEKILVHCIGGCGRTGTMGAAYWICKGLPAEEAITRIRESNPLAIEDLEQAKSLHRLESHLKSERQVS
jgi:atypical dual specificity phosphatase